MLRLLFLSFVSCAACSVEQPPLIADQVLVSQPVPGASMGAAYMTLENTSSQQIRLTKISSPQFESVEMHETILENGISRMRKLQEVVVPPSETIAFEPGGKHLMIRYPASTPEQITLQFYTAETLLLSIDIAPQD